MSLAEARTAAMAVTRLLPLATLALASPAQDRLFVQVPTSPALQAWETEQRAADPYIERIEYVRIDQAVLARIDEGSHPTNRVQMSALGKTIDLDFHKVRRIHVGHTVFHANVVGDQDGWFVIAREDFPLVAANTAYGGHTQFGDVGQVSTAGCNLLLQSTGIGDTHAVFEWDRPETESAAGDCGTPDEVEGPRPGPGAAGGEHRDPAFAHRTASVTVIDVAVHFTTRAKQLGGGAAGMAATMAARLGVSNRAAANSGVQHEFRLVYNAEWVYAESSSMSTDLSRFRNNAGVQNVAELFGGDFNMCIRSTRGGACGIATGIRTSTSRAYCIASRTCFGQHSDTHEMGHLAGCGHDRGNGSGFYSYSHGDHNPGFSRRSIMAYTPGPRVNQWSSDPARGFLYGGQVLGTPNDDNARSNNDTAAYNSGLRPTRAYYWQAVGGTGVAGSSGKPRVTFRGTTNQAVPIEATIDRLVPGATSAIVFGGSCASSPFLAGTLVTGAPLLVLPLTPAGSSVTIDLAAVTSLATGTVLAIQYVGLDAGAARGVSVSDGVKVEIP
ncbi:MAG: M12 family metallo-peptidase [Planctomycetota bacterium]